MRVVLTDNAFINISHSLSPRLLPTMKYQYLINVIFVIEGRWIPSIKRLVTLVLLAARHSAMVATSSLVSLLLMPSLVLIMAKSQ